jgi:hypothetical protein
MVTGDEKMDPETGLVIETVGGVVSAPVGGRSIGVAPSETFPHPDSISKTDRITVTPRLIEDGPE